MEISSIQEFIDIIEQLQNKYTYHEKGIRGESIEPKFLFRGHGNHEGYKLLPLIRREIITSSGARTQFSQLEYNILSDFISEAKCYDYNIPENDLLAWMEVAQHYGVPTRLMDLTENPLIALYFACRSKSDKTASVWIINEKSYKKIFYNQGFLELTIDSQVIVQNIINREIICLGKPEMVSVPEYRYPWIYKPLHRKERMNSQASMFMIWGSMPCSLERMVEDEHYMNLTDACNDDMKQRGILCAIKIKPDKKAELLRQLDMLGINEKFIYPGLDGVGKSIALKYS